MKKGYLKIVDVYILVNEAQQEQHLLHMGGPDTYNSPHQMGAMWEAVKPLFVQKKYFETIKSLSVSD